MFRKSVFLILTALFFAVPAFAQQNDVKEVLPLTTISTAGGTVIAQVQQKNHSSGYLVVKTTNEVNTASLQITFRIEDGYGGLTSFCAASAITDETTSTYAMGIEGTNTHALLATCFYPIPANTNFGFTVSGADASFDVQAQLLFVSNPN